MPVTRMAELVGRVGIKGNCMYIDTYANGEAKAARTNLNCACLVCQGKSHATNAVAYDVPSTLKATVPSSIKVDSDGTLTGSISEGEEVDIFGLSVVAGQTYSVALRGIGDNALSDPLLAILDENTDLVNYDDDGGAGISSLLTFTAVATGTYYIVAQSVDPTDTGDYSVDVWEQRETDQVPDTLAGAVTIEIGTTFGHIETSEDIDTYKIYLQAGTGYTIRLDGGADYETDYEEVPAGELDTVLGLFGPDGSFIGEGDDNDFPSDISSSVTFVAQESGYYTLAATAYEDQTGGYTLDVTAFDPEEFSPLDAINWVDAENIPYVTVDGVKTAYVYFGDSDENFNQTGDDGEPMVTIDWNNFEKGQVMLALEEFERILGINYEVTEDVEEATFRLLKTESEEYGAYFYPQDPAFGDDKGVGVFNVLSGAWTFDQQQSLERGGYSFAVILHEFGHAHGLSHPHDNGGGSEILLGVTGATGSLGLYDLNQGVYTVMSYNDAWDLHPDGPTPFSGANIDSGWSGTLSAFDIAVLQDRYGVTDRATGNDVYTLGDANDQGTFYQTIWDSAGTDEIRYNGARATQIDLTAATLDYSPTGGGVVSFVDNIFGGYTIAGGVVVENATGGSGSDALLGNGGANVLTGNAGDDYLMGRGGGDVLNGGAGIDTVSYRGATGAVSASLSTGRGAGSAAGDRLIDIEKVEGSAFADALVGGNNDDSLVGFGGNDALKGGNGRDTLSGGGGDDLLDGGNEGDTLAGGGGNDKLNGGNDNDALSGGDGDDKLYGGNDDDKIDGGAGNDKIDGGNDNDKLTGGAGNDVLIGFNGNDTLDGGIGNDKLEGGNERDRLIGGDGNDLLNGGNGSDSLAGGAGKDTLIGGAGDDTFVFADLGSTDTITDFKTGEDAIDVSDIDAVAGTAPVDAFRWIGSNAFSGAAGELRSYATGGNVFLSGDVDGDKIGDFVIALGQSTVVQADIIFA